MINAEIELNHPNSHVKSSIIFDKNPSMIKSYLGVFRHVNNNARNFDSFLIISTVAQSNQSMFNWQLSYVFGNIFRMVACDKKIVP